MKRLSLSFMTVCLLLSSVSFIFCDEPEKTVLSSLHGKYQGMRTYVEAKDGDPHFIGPGIEEALGLDYDDLPCKSCHSMMSFNEPDNDICNNCHKRSRVRNLDCLGCHGKQLMERLSGLSDVHRRKASTRDCMDCHSLKEIHGDRKVGFEPYISLREEGAMDTACVNCHDEDSLSAANHAIHKNTLDCSACHVTSVVTCYNCHMDTYLETENDSKSMVAQVKDWIFLVNDEKGKVHSGNFQSITSKDKSFVVFAPYFAHAVTDKPRKCNDCHANDAVRELEATGKIVVSSWDEARNKLVTREGVIPVVDGKLQMEFFTYDMASKTWSSMGNSADFTQYGFCTPLTEDQVGKLKIDMNSAD